jgi:hypothetical protein
VATHGALPRLRGRGEQGNVCAFPHRSAALYVPTYLQHKRSRIIRDPTKTSTRLRYSGFSFFGLKHSLDSLLLARHGKIVTEACYAAYKAGIPHAVNSV